MKTAALSYRRCYWAVLRVALEVWRFSGGRHDPKWIADLCYRCTVQHDQARIKRRRCFVAVRNSDAVLKSMLAADKKEHVHNVAVSAASVPRNETWNSIRPLGACGKKKAFAITRPLPALADRNGKLVADTKGRNLRWFEHSCQIENADPITPIDILQKTHSRQLAAFPDHPKLVPQYATSWRDLEITILQAKDGAFGNDVVPNSVFRTAPHVFGQLYHTLALKQSCTFCEPLQHKGGTLMSLFKSSGGGQHHVCSSHRGILLVNNSGKICRKVVRNKTVPLAEQTFHDCQRGGLPGRSTEQAAHVLRSFLEFAKNEGHSVGILFVDAISAFYSVLRQFIFNMGSTDEDIAKLFAKFDLPPAAIHELYATIDGGPIFDQIDVSPHLKALLTELHHNAWFCTEGVEDVAETGTGTKPGDPFGDLVFNFLFAKILDVIHQRLQSEGIGFKVQTNGCRTLSSRGPLKFAEGCDTAFVDDLAVLIMPASSHMVLDAVAIAATVVCDSLVKYAIRINCKPGKTEALIAYNGPDAKTFEKALWNSPSPRIPFRSAFFGDSSIGVVKTYKHLGGYVHYRACMFPEVAHRAGQSRAAEIPIQKTVLKNQAFEQADRLNINFALSRSRLSFNSAVWPALNSKQRRKFNNRYMQMLRGPLRLVNNSEVRHSNEKVLVIANANDPDEWLAIQRLQYMWRLLHCAPQVLIDLLQASDGDPRSWVWMLHDDLQWMKFHLFSSDGIPDHFGLEEASEFVLATSRGRWKNLVNKAAKIARMRRRNAYVVSTGTDRLRRAFAKIGVDDDVVQSVPASKAFKCDICGSEHVTLQGLSRHRASDHQMFHIANYYTDDRVCRWCLTLFHTKNRVTTHLKTTKSCLRKLVATQLPRPMFAPLHMTPVERAFLEREPALVVSGPKLIDRPVVVPPLPIHDADRSIVQVDRTVVPLAPVFNPSIHPVLGRTYFVLHLFSGRRRPGDFQQAVDALFASRQYTVVVLSLDVLFGDKGDLMKQANVDFWIGKIRQGHVIAVVGGPPCETWSTARYLPDGPGPVRSRDAPYGISSIQSIRQLWQVIVGNTLLFVALEFAAECVAAGAMAIIEHPAVTALHERYSAPSIWNLSIMNWFKSCAVVDFVTFLQGNLGANHAKPTTLMTVRVPSLELSVHANSSTPVRPWNTLSGRDAEGRYRTAVAKEYPAAMCGAMATALAADCPVVDYGPPDAQVVISDFAACIDYYVGLEDFASQDIGPDFAGHVQL